MRARLCVEVIGEPGRAVDHRLHGGVLRIEDAKRIGLEAAQAVRVEFVAAAPRSTSTSIAR